MIHCKHVKTLLHLSTTYLLVLTIPPKISVVLIYCGILKTPITLLSAPLPIYNYQIFQ